MLIVTTTKALLSFPKDFKRELYSQPIV